AVRSKRSGGGSGVRDRARPARYRLRIDERGAPRRAGQAAGGRGRHRTVPRERLMVRYSTSMKMHSPGHSSADSMTASSMPAGTAARPSTPPGSEKTLL